MSVTRWGRWALVLGLSLYLAAVQMGWWQSSILSRLDGWWYDTRLALLLPQQPPSKVVIVDIDEKSLAAVGQWPWPRAKVAQLIDQLGQTYHASAIGMDVVFAESGDNPLKSDILSLLKDVSPSSAASPLLTGLLVKTQQDVSLAAAINRNPVVLGYYFDTSGVGLQQSGALPSPVFDVAVAPALGSLAANGYGANLASLQSATDFAGHFNAWADADGVHRQAPMLVQYQGNFYGAFSLAMLSRYAGGMPIIPAFTEAGEINGLDVGDWHLPLSSRATTLIPYYGKARTFRYLSAVDVLTGRVSPALLQNKLVIVGTTAPGLMDLRVSPLDKTYPGVEAHANLIQGALDHQFVRELELGKWLAIYLLMAGCVWLWGIERCPPWLSACLVVSVLGGAVGVNLWLWSVQQLAVPLVLPWVQLVLVYGLHLAWGFISERKRRRALSTAFGSYVPPELVEKMADAPQAFLSQMQGEQREMTVLFSDIRDFTRMSEGLSPTDLANLINTYLSAQTQHIQSTHGTIDKYIGDAIMAFWGAPVTDANHASHAVSAALAMQQAMHTLNQHFQQQGWPALAVGIGLNSGSMVVGNMGSDFRRAYTVMGDAVNLASRLESLTKQYGVPILCGEGTKLAASDFVWREVDWIRVKGKLQAVTMWQPFPAGTRIGGLPEWQAALDAYRQGQFDQALAVLTTLTESYPRDGLYAVFLARVRELTTNQPARWDGVFEQTVK